MKFMLMVPPHGPKALGFSSIRVPSCILTEKITSSATGSESRNGTGEEFGFHHEEIGSAVLVENVFTHELIGRNFKKL